MVDSQTEGRIKEIVKLYLDKMDRSEFVMQGITYFKELSATLEPQAASSNDPEIYNKLSELYIWAKMLLLSEDVSEDILNSHIDRLVEDVNKPQ